MSPGGQFSLSPDTGRRPAGRRACAGASGSRSRPAAAVPGRLEASSSTPAARAAAAASTVTAPTSGLGRPRVAASASTPAGRPSDPSGGRATAEAGVPGVLPDRGCRAGPPSTRGYTSHLKRMQSPADPAGRTGTIGVEAFDAAYGAGFQGLDDSPHAVECELVEDGGAFVAHRPIDADRPPPRRFRRRHPTDRGAADPHRRRRRREHGPGGKAGRRGRCSSMGNEPARFDQVTTGARRHLYGRPAPSGGVRSPWYHFAQDRGAPAPKRRLRIQEHALRRVPAEDRQESSRTGLHARRCVHRNRGPDRQRTQSEEAGSRGDRAASSGRHMGRRSKPRQGGLKFRAVLGALGFLHREAGAMHQVLGGSGDEALADAHAPAGLRHRLS